LVDAATSFFCGKQPDLSWLYEGQNPYLPPVIASMLSNVRFGILLPLATAGSHVTAVPRKDVPFVAYVTV
jgi:hypothetical protein